MWMREHNLSLEGYTKNCNTRSCLWRGELENSPKGETYFSLYVFWINLNFKTMGIYYLLTALPSIKKKFFFFFLSRCWVAVSGNFSFALMDELDLGMWQRI